MTKVEVAQDLAENTGMNQIKALDIVEKVSPTETPKLDIEQASQQALQEAGMVPEETKTPEVVTEQPKLKISKEEPLITEAKKYKSAEEFIKSQGTPVYHGTNADFVEFNKEFRGTNTGKTPTNMTSISFTDNPGVAETFGKNVKEAYLDIKNPKIIDVGGVSYSEPYKN